MPAVPRPPSPVAATMHDRDLNIREARLAEREKQIAEQQRVLMEGYRLLRDVREAPSTQPAAAARTSWPPPRPAPNEKGAPELAGVPRRAAYNVNSSPTFRAFRDASPEPESLWSRLRRGLLGLGKPAVQDGRF
jgi:hypothetical protein